MSQSAFIKLVEGSEAASLTLDEVKEHFLVYQQQTSHTGQQVDWDYEKAAFPYTIETKPEGEGKWFYLKGINELYTQIVIGVGSEALQDSELADGEAGEQSDDAEGAAEPARQHFIQIVLPAGCTHGDKAKGNEFCKFLAKRLKAELHLFNGRVMYFNPRK